MQLYHKQVGESGAPIIVLHGLFGSSDNWQAIGKALSEEYKVFMIDQRNHGRSPRSHEFTYEAMSEDLLEFIGQHNLIMPVIIGHSMGGKTAMKFAIQYPDLFSKLVVVDISPKYYPVHHGSILEGLKSINLQQLSSRQEADEQLARHEPHPTVRQFLLKNLHRTDQGTFDWRINLPVLDEQIENVGEALSDEKSIDNPTLFLNGERSDYIKAEDRTFIRKIFTKAEFITVRNAGHWVHAEKPDEFVSIVRQFIKSR
ncbi:alpha/beta fold hydrolase [Rhodocytophaga rosea]|uniref:Alpha/beta fold hydrolase n=1 Tax=Rhodocytophaga rosea TaxID=2704465 RepID=A0A6C0GKC9_9BACT|nr:alpha/beta fold hydrolase [Rhodocytophaga rosea]QHT68133.1 alpha/beta fold hydrolase [Rhodocytophaga rosea]